jgi:hypothetical protein
MGCRPPERLMIHSLRDAQLRRDSSKVLDDSAAACKNRQMPSSSGALSILGRVSCSESDILMERMEGDDHMHQANHAQIKSKNHHQATMDRLDYCSTNFTPAHTTLRDNLPRKDLESSCWRPSEETLPQCQMGDNTSSQAS